MGLEFDFDSNFSSYNKGGDETKPIVRFRTIKNLFLFFVSNIELYYDKTYVLFLSLFIGFGFKIIY